MAVSVEVSFLVGCQVGALCEAFVATGVCTKVRFFASVGPEVSPQVEIEGELLPAQFTFERFLSLINFRKVSLFTVWTS